MYASVNISCPSGCLKGNKKGEVLSKSLAHKSAIMLTRSCPLKPLYMEGRLPARIFE